MDGTLHWWDTRSQFLEGLSKESYTRIGDLAYATLGELVELWATYDPQDGMSEEELDTLLSPIIKSQFEILKTAFHQALTILTDELVSGRGNLAKVESERNFYVNKGEILNLILDYGLEFMKHLTELNHQECFYTVVRFLIDTQVVVYHDIGEAA